MGPVSLAVAGIGSLGAALGAFFKWDQITGFVQSLASQIGSGLMAIPGMVIGAISAMASGIANAIKGAISSLGRALTPNGGGGQHQEVVPDGFGGMTPAPQCWTPPPRANGMQETRVNINLDGYRLGEAVAYHVARANTHVAAAGKCDSGAMHMPVDLQTA